MLLGITEIIFEILKINVESWNKQKNVYIKRIVPAYYEIRWILPQICFLKGDISLDVFAKKKKLWA